jgi:Phage Mu protein F like protein
MVNYGKTSLRTKRNDLERQILALNLSEMRPEAPESDLEAKSVSMPAYSANHALAQATVLRTARLQAVANWLLSKDAQALDDLSAQLKADITEINPTGAGSRKQRNARLVKLFVITDKHIASAFSGMSADMLARFDQLAQIIAQANTKKLKQHHDIDTEGFVDALEVLVLGAPLPEHYEKLKNDLQFRFKVAVRQGVAAGETAEEIASRLTGSLPASPINAAEPSDAQKAAIDKRLSVGVRVFDGTENSLDKVIQAAVTALSNQADIASAEDEDDDDQDTMCWTWCSVLDMATCPACEALDGMQWDNDFQPIGEAFDYPGDPGIHIGCRCSIIRSNQEEENPTQHPARKDEVTNVVSKPRDISFNDYISQYSDSELKQIFGEGAVKNWRRGVITDAQLIGQKEHLMDLEAFKKAEL